MTLIYIFPIISGVFFSLSSNPRNHKPIGSMYGICTYICHKDQLTKCREIYHTLTLWEDKKTTSLIFSYLVTVLFSFVTGLQLPVLPPLLDRSKTNRALIVVGSLPPPHQMVVFSIVMSVLRTVIPWHILA